MNALKIQLAELFSLRDKVQEELRILKKNKQWSGMAELRLFVINHRITQLKRALKKEDERLNAAFTGN